MRFINTNRLLFTLFFGCWAMVSKAQLVSCNVFLQGKYIEVGINLTGAYGTSAAAPVGYHAKGSGNGALKNTCTSSCPAGLTAIGFVADPDKDGWTVGSPTYFGDYFMPGVPQEGWEIESNGHRGSAHNYNGLCASTSLYTGGLSGNNLSYNSSGATRSGTWQGVNTDTIQITQVTSLDTGNLYFTVRVTLKNNGLRTKSDVYYLRTVDPDNDQTAPGGTFNTVNTITYQLPNTLGATLVSATGTVYTRAYLGLGTLDCRAKCFILTSGSTFIPPYGPDSMYNQLGGGVQYTGTTSADQAIGIVFNLGNIAPGDSVTFSYAYVLRASDLLVALNSTVANWTATSDTAVNAHVTKDTAHVCSGAPTTITISNPGGLTWNWTSLTGETLSTYTGNTTTVTAGSTLIRLWAIAFTGSTGCGPANDTLFIDIDPSIPIPVTPTAGSNTPVCAGSTLNLTATTSTPGVSYAWTGPSGFTSTLQNPSIAGATVAAAGTYSVVAFIGNCSSGMATTTVTVNSLPATITPSVTAVCTGRTVSLSIAASGGVWSATNTNATVSSAGLVTGVAGGIDTIRYTVGACVSEATVNVVSSAAVSPATSSICVGSGVILTDPVSGGVWSASNTFATVGSTGVVTGIAPGTDTISYTMYFGVTPVCSNNATVNVLNAPSSILPATPVSICLGSTASLSDGVAGGVWSSGATGVATVGTSGVVTGVGVGTAVISYAIGTCVATKMVTVVNAPSAISPLSVALCQGDNITLTDGVLGGIWSSSNGLVASIGTSGTVTALAPGNVTITYAIGACTTTSTVTVNAAPVAINPLTPVSICLGATSTLTDATPSGTWSSSNSGIASVSGGIVTGAGVGTATISYTLGSCSALKTVTVVSAPGPISPISSSVCVGASVNLTDGVGGGIWSSSNLLVATVGTTGTVTGVAPGNVTITYAIGTCTTTATVTVNANPSAITPSGPVIICVGANSILSDVGVGTWTSGNTSIATVGSTGIVTGVGAGTVNISFTNASGCAAVKTVTVSISPAPISPAVANVCLGNTTTLTNSVGGGTWTSGNVAVATIGSTGIVTGVGVGSTTMTYTIGTCFVISTVTVSPAVSAGAISGPSNVCVAGTITLSDPAPSGTWSSSNTAIATVGSSSGIVTGVGGGTVTISYTVANACGSASATKTVNVVPSGISPITGPVSICAGTFTTLSDATAGGSWSASNSHATISGTGLLTGISSGIDTITYTVTNACGTFTATRIENIGAFLTAGSISGPSVVCAGNTIPLTDPAPGGTWSVSNSHASVGGSGLVTGLTAGLDTVMYTVTASCGSAVATHLVSVNPLPDAGGIVGAATTCAGIITPYSETMSGGTWSLSNIIIATINSFGVVTPITPGIDTIKYTVTNSCGTAVARKVLTIGAYLTAGSISGPSVQCVGTTITLTDPVSGGTWSASNGSASVTTGTVTGLVAGVDTIMYSVSSSCGTAVASHVVTVNPLPDAGSITGPSNICTGTITTYTNASPGGTWSVTNSHATIAPGGVVTAVSAGVDTIIYTVVNSCGTATATLVVTIGLTLTASPITGPGNICLGSTATLSDATLGGVWSSTNTTVATIGSTGIINALSVGTTTISYSVTSSCGTATATKVVTVSAVAVVGPISGPSTMCTGTFTIFTDPVPGGTWTSTNATATVSISGVVTAISTGVDTILYTVTTGCGSAVASKVVTIAPGVGAGTITGPSSVCAGATITLIDAMPGGTWSSSNATATVGSTGVVTGVAAGVDTIMYSVMSSCGLAVAMHTVNVISSGSVAPITGPSNVCVGSLIMLSDATPGGAWSSSNTHATITTAGVVTGITPGTDTISYTISGSCGITAATKIITIGSVVTAGPVTGPSTVCEGATITLTDATGGGTWSSTGVHASVVGSTGVVTGVAAGTETIVYTIAGSCGGSSASMVVTVNPAPNAGAIGGPDSVCIGTSVPFTDFAPGGIWSAGNGNATVSGTGMVTGVSAGTDPISYSVTNGCGTASAVKVIVVTNIPAAGIITGSSSVCVGSGITLTDTIPGGTWVASNGNAIVAGPGVIDGVLVGIDTIFYVMTNLCGTSTTSKIIAVNPVPFVAPISGPTSQCVSTTVTMTDPVSGGIWTSSNPAVATIGIASGAATGMSVGTTTITYTVTNAFGCPTSVTLSDTVMVAPVTPAITGGTNVCVGTTTTLSDAAGGGTWSSANPSIATVGPASGIVTGMSAGATTISYTITNICGTAFVTQPMNVNPVPVVAAISGVTHQCEGATSTLADATTGGIWSSTNTAIATVGSSSGIVSGIVAGTVTINYTLSSSGCTVIVSTPDTVVAAPVVAAITGTTHECVGLTTTLSNSTIGGTWSSATPSVATVGAVSGIVTGMAGGVTNINYSVTNGAGCTTTVSVSDTVNTPPVVAAIAGPANVCVGAAITLTDATAGGAWSAANANATVSGGVVTGVTAGTDMISYTVTNGCGSTSATSMVTINPLTTAGTITGSSNVCVGSTTTLTDAVAGGIWSASNGNASIGSTGIVTGVSIGTDTIAYTVTGPCGTAVATRVITIGTMPTVAAISGSATVCKGSTITLTDATAGGTWSSSNAHATVGSTGIVTGVTAGSDTILYTVSNACGSVSASKVITITQSPSPGLISGASDVCPGASISLSAIGGATGGTWSSSNSAVATVSGGVVAGVAMGTTTISYTVSNGCGSRTATHAVNVLAPADCNTRVGTTTKITDEITVYPNPNKGMFTVELITENNEEANVIITNIIGKKVKEFSLNTNKATGVHLNVAPGIYLLTATTANGVRYVTKLTIQ